MPFAKLPDAQLHYELDGPDHAPVLLFSNSLGATVQMWEPQLSFFSRHFRVLRYDTRGHGQSTVSPGPYSIEKLSDDVLRLLDALRLPQVLFCGISMGGMTGMFLGANAPQRFKKLVLCNTAAKIGTAEKWNARIARVNQAGMKAISEAVVEGWLTATYRATHTEQTATMQAMLERNDPQGYVANCAAVRDMDYRQNLSAIKVPTLVVAGSSDASIPLADAHFLVENISGARFTELAAAHISNVEAQDEFNAQVLNFLLA